ncbi:MAG: class I SAM-dependent methyltransferase [Isosphaeraceae bacterium]
MATATEPFVYNGHFYSPVIDHAEIERDCARIWPGEDVTETIGIDYGRQSHLKILSVDFPRFYGDYQYPRKELANSEPHFYEENGQFADLDSRILFVLLRALRPRKMIEIGSGFSSLVTAHVNRTYLGGQLDFTCIEPYPRQFLLDGVPGISRLIVSRVQDVPLETLTSLNPGDILFIDSSHVSKTGSDVNHLYFEVLPRLKPGVIIHVHDIFLPHDYPRQWLDEGRSWNEQYLLQAMLMYTKSFDVLFGCRYAYFAMRPELTRACGGTAHPGHSIWLVRTGAVDRRFLPNTSPSFGTRAKRRAKTALKRLINKVRPV